MNNKLGQEPAYANEYNSGMNKRFYAACAAMQGILAGDSNTLTCTTKDDVLSAHKTYSYDYSKIVKNAFKLADELLKQENQ